MKRLVLSGILASFAALATTSSARAEQRITIEACNGVDVQAVNRILDLEYRDTGAGDLLVGLSCDGDNLTLRVSRATSDKRVLVVDLSAVPTVAKPRTVAILIVELSNELVAGLEPEARSQAEPEQPAPGPSNETPPPALATRDEDPSETTSEADTLETEEDADAGADANAGDTLVSTEDSLRARAATFATGAPGSEPLSLGPMPNAIDLADDPRSMVLASPSFSGALGYAKVSQIFSTPDDCTMCNYTIDVSAPSANLGAQIRAKYGERYLFAAAADYQYAKSSIHRMQVDDSMLDTGYKLHRLHAGARAGYTVDRSSEIAAYARMGIQHDRLVIENHDFQRNSAKLPSEIFSGVTVGLMLEFPKLTSKTTLGFTADMLMTGRLEQTAGLSDGAVSSTAANYMGATMDYQWTKTVKIRWNYNYSQQRTEWRGVDPNSQRDHDQGLAERVDSVHALFAGLTKSL